MTIGEPKENIEQQHEEALRMNEDIDCKKLASEFVEITKEEAERTGRSVKETYKKNFLKFWTTERGNSEHEKALWENLKYNITKENLEELKKEADEVYKKIEPFIKAHNLKKGDTIPYELLDEETRKAFQDWSGVCGRYDLYKSLLDAIKGTKK